MKMSKAGTLELRSPTFKNNGNIPEKYTCDGDNISPPLTIGMHNFHNVQSLALVMESENTVGETQTHWLVWNINPVVAELEENTVTPGAIVGKNSFDTVGYQGPNPVYQTHRYDFCLYALDTLLALPEGSTRDGLEEAMEGHIVAYSELTCIYKGRPSLNQRKPTSFWGDPYKE